MASSKTLTLLRSALEVSAITAHALGQHVDGLVAVAERSIRFEIEVPWILSVFAPKIEAAAKHYAVRLMAS